MKKISTVKNLGVVTTIAFQCKACGGDHDLPLDKSGHYSGPFPCGAKGRISLQVEPTTWRALVEGEAAKTVH